VKKAGLARAATPRKRKRRARPPGKVRTTLRKFRKRGARRSSVRQAVSGPHEPDEDRYEQGYRAGYYDGGEKLLEDVLPKNAVVPDITVREALAAGVVPLMSRSVPLLDAGTVHGELESAMRERRPYALIRLGDGELLTLAHDVVLPSSEVLAAAPFLSYSGVDLPDPGAREVLADAVRVASLVGIPTSRHPHFQPLFFQVCRAYGIDPYRLRLTVSTINYQLEERGLLAPLMEGRKILIVGNAAAQLANVLSEKGLHIAGAVHPVQGMRDVSRVVREAAAFDFDLALVAAGIPAVPICVHLAGVSGKVAMDFGHLANRMAGLAPIGSG